MNKDVYMTYVFIFIGIAIAIIESALILLCNSSDQEVNLTTKSNSWKKKTPYPLLPNFNRIYEELCLPLFALVVYVVRLGI